jgi:hypothetical protein
MIRKNTARDDMGRLIPIFGGRPLPINGAVPTVAGLVHGGGKVEKVLTAQKIELQSVQISTEEKS